MARILTSTSTLRDNEIRVILRSMTGEEHTVGIQKTQLTSELLLFAGRLFHKYDELLHLSVNGETITGNERMEHFVSSLEETGQVIQLLFKDPPPVVPSFMMPDVLITRPLYGHGGVGEGW